MTLKERLESLNAYPFHMPGHKRNCSLFKNDAFKLDFTEINGTDDLHHPAEILKERMAFASEVYGSKKTLFLINGSTCGLLAAVSACAKPGESLLLARNCHKSVYNAVFLRNLKPEYVYPPVSLEGISGGISPKDVEEALVKTGAKTFVMVSPTYEGIVSDIEAVSAVCRKHGCVLIVDEAHGAHFSFYEGFPQSAAALGADIVIQSLHKTLPSLTQTALLHICTDRVCEAEIERYLSIYQSSSPSYILLSSIDSCIEYMKSSEGRKAAENYFSLLSSFREKNKARIMGGEITGSANVFDTDPSKIVIWGGSEAAAALRAENLEPEMENLFYTLALTSIGDTREGFDRLSKAIFSLPPKTTVSRFEKPLSARVRLSPYKAYLRRGEEIPLNESAGRISKTAAYIYPPGIPIINTGEEITAEALTLINKYKQRGFDVKGITDKISCTEA